MIALARKEMRTELRSPAALAAAGLFAAVTSAMIALVFFNRNVQREAGLPEIVAGCFWTAILFSLLLSLPRTFLQEEEGGTADLLRLVARPHAVWWGKMLFNAAQALGLGGLSAVLIVVMVGARIAHPALFVVSTIGGTLAVAATVTLSGAIAAGATGRAALAATVSIPLLLGVLQQAIGATTAAFGASALRYGTPAAVGLVAYAAVAALIGPWIYAASLRN